MRHLSSVIDLGFFGRQVGGQDFAVVGLGLGLGGVLFLLFCSSESAFFEMLKKICARPVLNYELGFI